MSNPDAVDSVCAKRGSPVLIVFEVVVIITFNGVVEFWGKARAIGRSRMSVTNSKGSILREWKRSEMDATGKRQETAI
jgi:hypothetical protein